MGNLTYDLLKRGLDASIMRQEAISNNIANINTTNYKCSKVEFEELLHKAMNNVGLKKTHEKHFGIEKIADVEPKIGKKTETYLNDNGNNVDIDLEMTELAANEIYYSILVRQLNAKLGSLNYVINK